MEEFLIEKRVDLNSPQSRRQVDLLVRDALADIIRYAHSRAFAYAPARTGNLKRNISGSDVHKVGMFWEGEVTVGRRAPYAKWVESGTGIFGAFHQRIYPKTGSVLVFIMTDWYKQPGKEVRIYAKSVKGQVGQHYMKRAYEDTDKFFVPLRLQLLKREIAAAAITT